MDNKEGRMTDSFHNLNFFNTKMIAEWRKSELADNLSLLWKYSPASRPMCYCYARDNAIKPLLG
jgi:hypothetical protein